MDVDKLLDQVKIIRRKHDELDRISGSHFNFFSAASVSTNEVVICSVIRELIDPKGSHAQGSIYLKLFLKYVLQLDPKIYEAIDLNSVCVERERKIDNKRRIDLYISIPGKMCIPIEAKIYAGDQKNQCYDYYKYAINSPIYYLTLDGHEPSEYSRKDLTENQIKLISFEKEILVWLEECLKRPETIRITSIRELIIQFIDLLQDLTGQVEDALERDIVEIILKSRENLETADQIASIMKSINDHIFNRYFHELARRIESKYPFLVWHDDCDNVTYDKYGIYYIVKELSTEKYKLALQIQAENDYVYAGFTICDEDDYDIPWKKVVKRNFILNNHLMKLGFEDDEPDWLAWKYIGDETEEMPNFKYHNDAFYSMAEPEYFNHFIEETMKVIDDLISSAMQNRLEDIYLEV